jgi:hypothetical protein
VFFVLTVVSCLNVLWRLVPVPIPELVLQYVSSIMKEHEKNHEIYTVVSL